MKTERTIVTQTLKVWAIPHSKWVREHSPSPIPFDFEVRTGSAWEDGAVMVHEQEVMLVVPAGIDLLAATIATLQAAIRATRAEAEKKCTDLDEQIRGLLMLTHQPKEDESVVSTK